MFQTLLGSRLRTHGLPSEAVFSVGKETREQAQEKHQRDGCSGGNRGKEQGSYFGERDRKEGISAEGKHKLKECTGANHGKGRVVGSFPAVRARGGKSWEPWRSRKSRVAGV